MKLALRFAVSLGIACVPLGLLVGGIIKSCVDDKKKDELFFEERVQKTLEEKRRQLESEK